MDQAHWKTLSPAVPGVVVSADAIGGAPADVAIIVVVAIVVAITAVTAVVSPISPATTIPTPATAPPTAAAVEVPIPSTMAGGAFFFFCLVDFLPFVAAVVPTVVPAAVAATNVDDKALAVTLPPPPSPLGFFGMLVNRLRRACSMTSQPEEE